MDLRASHLAPAALTRRAIAAQQRRPCMCNARLGFKVCQHSLVIPIYSRVLCLHTQQERARTPASPRLTQNSSRAKLFALRLLSRWPQCRAIVSRRKRSALCLRREHFAILLRQRPRGDCRTAPAVGGAGRSRMPALRCNAFLQLRAQSPAHMQLRLPLPRPLMINTTQRNAKHTVTPQGTRARRSRRRATPRPAPRRRRRAPPTRPSATTTPRSPRAPPSASPARTPAPARRRR